MEILIGLLWTFIWTIAAIGVILAFAPSVGQAVAAVFLPLFDRLLPRSGTARWMAQSLRNIGVSLGILTAGLIGITNVLAIFGTSGGLFKGLFLVLLLSYAYGMVVVGAAALALLFSVLSGDKRQVCDTGVSFICAGILLAGCAAAVSGSTA